MTTWPNDQLSGDYKLFPYPRSIALDVARGEMYWSTANSYGQYYDNPYSNKIQKAKLDGSGVVRALTSRPLCAPTLYVAVPECGELACLFVFLTAPPSC